MTQAATTELTAKERNALLGVLKGLDPTTRDLPPESRRAKRHAVLDYTPIHTLPKSADGNKRVVRVMLKDVAAGGVGLYSPTTMATGERFALPVRFQEGGGKLYLCEVTFSKQSAPKQFTIGARFVESVEDPHADAGIPSEWLAN